MGGGDGRHGFRYRITKYEIFRVFRDLARNRAVPDPNDKSALIMCENVFDERICPVCKYPGFLIDSAVGVLKCSGCDKTYCGFCLLYKPPHIFTEEETVPRHFSKRHNILVELPRDKNTNCTFYPDQINNGNVELVYTAATIPTTKSEDSSTIVVKVQHQPNNYSPLVFSPEGTYHQIIDHDPIIRKATHKRKMLREAPYVECVPTKKKKKKTNSKVVVSPPPPKKMVECLYLIPGYYWNISTKRVGETKTLKTRLERIMYENHLRPLDVAMSILTNRAKNKLGGPPPQNSKVPMINQIERVVGRSRSLIDDSSSDNNNFSNNLLGGVSENQSVVHGEMGDVFGGDRLYKHTPTTRHHCYIGSMSLSNSLYDTLCNDHEYEKMVLEPDCKIWEK